MISQAVLSSPPPVRCGRSGAFEVFASKTRRNLRDMPSHPTTWSFAEEGGDYTAWKEGFHEIGNWTNGFFAGMGVLALRATGEADYLRLLEGVEPLFREKLEEPNVANTMHDIGFLYSPFAVALFQHTGDVRYRDLALKAARTLSGRFMPGGYFRAWGRMDESGTDYDGLAIIDCLMNMPLLYWASDATGSATFREFAVRHTDTTLRHFVRGDGSVYHSFRFHPSTGAADRPDNYCGNHVESHWARGNTWAMYGFALAHRHTGEIRFLDAARTVTNRFLDGLGDDAVPVWDFRLKDGYPPIRDSSASAIAVCAIQLLESLGAADERMLCKKDQMLDAMISPEYFDADPSSRGVLRFGEIGAGHDAARTVYRARNAYTSWGDYFLMQALSHELGHPAVWW